jgi:hypothetical protein
LAKFSVVGTVVPTKLSMLLIALVALLVFMMLVGWLVHDAGCCDMPPSQ